ncbi:MAG: alpha/beta hydrolase [Microbacteriaceae bacterium]
MALAQTTDGTELFWDAQGSGEPLLLIAGQAMSHRGWLSILPQYTEKHRTIYFDHRGIGQSGPGVTEPYSTSLFAQDCLAILQAAGEEKAHIYGHSMGGRIAQELAIAHPESVRKVILGATTAGESQGKKRSREATRDLFSGDWRRLTPHFFSAQFVEEHEEIVRVFFRTDASPETLKQHYIASKTHDAWARLDQITAPTLILHGDADDLTPVENAILMAETIPDAQLAVLKDGLHGYFLEREDANDIALKFLAA